MSLVTTSTAIDYQISYTPYHSSPPLHRSTLNLCQQFVYLFVCFFLFLSLSFDTLRTDRIVLGAVPVFDIPQTRRASFKCLFAPLQSIIDWCVQPTLSRSKRHGIPAYIASSSRCVCQSFSSETYLGSRLRVWCL